MRLLAEWHRTVLRTRAGKKTSEEGLAAALLPATVAGRTAAAGAIEYAAATAKSERSDLGYNPRTE